MILTFEQVGEIVLKNPNKDIIAKGKAMADKLMMHLHGVGLANAIKQCKQFVSDDIFEVQKT
jgi:hypothetical protein